MRKLFKSNLKCSRFKGSFYVAILVVKSLHVFWKVGGYVGKTDVVYTYILLSNSILDRFWAVQSASIVFCLVLHSKCWFQFPLLTFSMTLSLHLSFGRPRSLRPFGASFLSLWFWLLCRYPIYINLQFFYPTNSIRSFVYFFQFSVGAHPKISCPILVKIKYFP